VKPSATAFVEGEVLRARIAAPKERRDHDAAVLDRVAELDGEFRFRCHAGESSG